MQFGLRAQVDQTEAVNAESRIALGVSVRRALGTTNRLHNSRSDHRGIAALIAFGIFRHA
jgi:hypothetical protein